MNNYQKYKEYFKQYNKINKERLSKYSKKYYIKNRDNILEKHKEYQINNKKKIASMQALYKKKNLVKVVENNRKNHIKRKYKIEPHIIDALYIKINKKCMICSCEMRLNTKKIDNMTIDHNHITGKVRGLLCRKCNSALGGFLDSVDILKLAIEYLNNNNLENLLYEK